MKLLCLDLATRTGFAEGEAGEIPPIIGAVVLKRRGESAETAAKNLGCFLRDRFTLGRPDLIVVEHYLHPSRMLGADVAITHLFLHGVVLGIAGPYGIVVKSVYPATVRTHFCGRASANIAHRPKGAEPRTPKEAAAARAATKAMVLSRAITLGYLPRGCTDSDKADAAALFSYAGLNYAGIEPSRLVLFGAAS